MPALHDACLRHARFYLTVLLEADRLYQLGDKSVKGALALFDAEWLNVAAAQKWVSRRIHKDNDAAALCSDYSSSAISLLSLRLFPSELIRWLDAAYDAASSLNDQEAMRWHKGNLGKVYRQVGNTERAIGCFQTVLEASRAARDENSELACLSNLASVHSDIGQHSRAIEIAQQAVKLAEDSCNLHNIGGLLGKIGTAYSRSGDQDRALLFHGKQLALAKETGDLRSEAEALNNLGVCYLMGSQYDVALRHFERATTLYEALSDHKNLIATFNNVGLIQMNTGFHDLALITFERQLDLSRKWENPYGEGRALYNSALCLDSLNRREEAIALAEIAVAVLEGTGSPDHDAAQLTLVRWCA
jgi:tetratricopeptide (TPR) repeat protein